MAPAEQLRISVTVSGGAALGAYEAGAMAALLSGVQCFLEDGDDRIRVDAVGGASAGAIVALLAAHVLTEGLDPVEVLHAAWVEMVSLDLMMMMTNKDPGSVKIPRYLLSADIQTTLVVVVVRKL